MMALYRFLLASTLMLALVPTLVAQPQPLFSFPDPDAPLTVEAEVYWGNLTVTGDAEDTVRLSVTHTALQGQPTPVTAWADYVTVEHIGNVLRIRGRRPAPGTFESVDLTLHVPTRARLLLRIEKGGEMRVTNMHDLVEINHHNGSVELEALRGFAVVSAVNGSVRATFDAVMPGQSMSFITLNGGIDLTLPADVHANLRLRSHKNGYVYSAFDLPHLDYPYQEEPGEDEPGRRYSKDPISVVSRIGGGGPWLVATTENGPIRLDKR